MEGHGYFLWNGRKQMGNWANFTLVIGVKSPQKITGRGPPCKFCLGNVAKFQQASWTVEDVEGKREPTLRFWNITHAGSKTSYLATEFPSGYLPPYFSRTKKSHWLEEFCSIIWKTHHLKYPRKIMICWKYVFSFRIMACNSRKIIKLIAVLGKYQYQPLDIVYL